MKLADLLNTLELNVRSARHNLGNEVTGGYASDLLSDVIANGSKGDVWITLQVHQNVVAVASMKDLAGIILVHARQPEDETIRKAESEGIPVLVSNLPAFELIGRLYSLGIRSARIDNPTCREATEPAKSPPPWTGCNATREKFPGA